MTGVPRSQVLLTHHFLSTAQTSPVWSSPPGFVTLVKSIYWYNGNAASATAITVVVGNGGVPVSRIDQSPIAAFTTLALNIWVALNPGDLIYGYCPTDDVVMWMSGAVLSGPNQFPVPSRSVVEALPSLPPPGIIYPGING